MLDLHCQPQEQFSWWMFTWLGLTSLLLPLFSSNVALVSLSNDNVPRCKNRSLSNSVFRQFSRLIQNSYTGDLSLYVSVKSIMKSPALYTFFLLYKISIIITIITIIIAQEGQKRKCLDRRFHLPVSAQVSVSAVYEWNQNLVTTTTERKMNEITTWYNKNGNGQIDR